ncbi:MAG: hypothetical protein HY904_10625 [Deltaproteobacteria bacterium]|nr:hypothetical protein [Deltaproteobacteria bacterium]
MSTERLADLPPEVARVLDAERRAPPPPDGARDRVRQRLALTVGAAAGVAAFSAAKGAALSAVSGALAGKSGAGVAGTTLASLLTAKVVVPAVMVVAVAGGVTVARVVERPARVAAVTAPVVARPAPSAAAPLVVIQPAPAPAPAVQPAPDPRAVPLSPVPVTRPATGTLPAERRLLDQARQALADHRGDAALVTLDRHREQYARGQLAEERDALRVMALADLGRAPEARRAAVRFLERHPHSVLRSAVESAVTTASPR